MLFITCHKCFMKIPYNDIIKIPYNNNFIYHSQRLCKWLIPAYKCPLINKPSQIPFINKPIPLTIPFPLPIPLPIPIPPIHLQYPIINETIKYYATKKG